MPEPPRRVARPKRFAAGKTLMPGGFIPPEQIKEKGPPHGVSRVGNRQEDFAAEIAKQLGK